ncbi:MAG: YraN family protein [Eubacterium sp.]|nr:YraN family protein [Eubacterium sp.]MBR1674931.1 YraN family protein [Eubacterium sp.]
MQNKRQVGSEKEEIAAEFLKAKGLRILSRNYKVRQAELDIVASDDESRILIFVEVKYRATSGRGISLEAVTPAKQKKICQAALFYMNQFRINPETVNIRFDVVGIDGEKITHIENAFMFSI